VWNNQGTVSRSGDGDGGYSAFGCYLEEPDGTRRLIAAKIAYYQESVPEHLREDDEDDEDEVTEEAPVAA
jgi:hypothetical protein